MSTNINYLKYLKYKNKYINLKNMIGGKPTDKEKLIKANIYPLIADAIIERQFDIDRAIKLMEKKLVGIKDTTMRSLLILQLLKNNVDDKKIEFLNENLFQYNYAFVNNITFKYILNFTKEKLYFLTLIIFIAYNKLPPYFYGSPHRLFDKKEILPLYKIVIILNSYDDKIIKDKYESIGLYKSDYLIYDDDVKIGTADNLTVPLQFDKYMFDLIKKPGLGSSRLVDVNEKFIEIVRSFLDEFKEKIESKQIKDKSVYDKTLLEVEINDYNFTDLTDKFKSKFPEEKLVPLITEIFSESEA